MKMKPTGPGPYATLVLTSPGPMCSWPGREMRVYEQYIIGMLTNLVNLPLSRIHNMIRMFVPSDDKDLSEAELQRFLSRMVEDGKIEVSAGMYKLRAQA